MPPKPNNFMDQEELSLLKRQLDLNMFNSKDEFSPETRRNNSPLTEEAALIKKS